jgi:hypothetical protein
MVHDKNLSTVAQTFFSVRFEAVFRADFERYAQAQSTTQARDERGDQPLCHQGRIAPLFLNNSLRYLLPPRTSSKIRKQ